MSTCSSISFGANSGFRNCVRLLYPDWRTIETYANASLHVTCWMSFAVLTKWANMFPWFGFDTLTINYTDEQGQSDSVTINCNFFGSDGCWVFLSADQSTQFAITASRGNIFDQYALALNARNVGSAQSSLQPCGQGERYDATGRLLLNQVMPGIWIRDGSFASSTSPWAE